MRGCRWCGSRPRPGELGGDLGFKPGVAGMAKTYRPVPLAPGHQRIAGEAAVGAQHNLHAPPAGADMAYDALDLLDAPAEASMFERLSLARAGADAEHVERQIAPAVIIAWKNLSPDAVQRIVGASRSRLSARRLAVGVEEQLDEQRSIAAASWPICDSVWLAAGACSSRLSVLLPASGAQPVVAPRVCRPGSLSPDRAAADRGRARPHIPVPGRRPLADQRGDLVLDPFRRAPIAETAGKPLDKLDRLVRGPQQQRAGIRGHRTASNASHTVIIDTSN